MPKPLYTQTRRVLTAKHYKVFGHITVEYASVDVGLKITLGGFLGHGVVQALVLSAPYTSLQLRNVMKSMAHLHMHEGSHSREMLNIVIGIHKKAGTLRNDIAHNLWRKGDRAGAVAPAYMEIRNEKPQLKGVLETHRDYTMADLEKCANGLVAANTILSKIHTSAEFQQALECNISTTNQAKDPSEGIS